MKNDLNTAAVSRAELPSVGALFEDGIFAGVSLDNDTLVALVLLPGEAPPSTWLDAVAWAEQQGGALPSRIDQIVLFKNVAQEFRETWYWSGEQHAETPDDAWGATFGYGFQNYLHKGLKGRARAVRRVPIQ